MKSISSKLSALLAAVGVAAVALPASDAQAQARDIKIGAPLALTGPLADEAKKQEVVWKMWLEKVNAAGGINVGGTKSKVQLVQYDYQSDGQRAAQLAEKLITDDKVDFLLSPFGSGHTKIVATIATRYETPVIACAASSESVFDQSSKFLYGTLSPNVGLFDPMIKHFREKLPSLKKVAVLGRDDVFPKATAQGISAAAKAAGLDVYYDQLYAVGTMDHSASLSAIKRGNPDWVYVTGYTQDLILARKQMQDLGVKAPIITMLAGPAYKEYIDGLGNLANGVTSSSWWHQATSYKGVGVWPTTEAFYNEFVAKEKADPGLRPRVVRGGDGSPAGCDRAGRVDRQEEGQRGAGQDRHQHLLRTDQVQPERHEPGARSADHPGAGQGGEGSGPGRHQERRDGADQVTQMPGRLTGSCG